MVGRLVQKQQIKRTGEQLGQKDPHLPAAAQFGNRPVKIRLFKTQPEGSSRPCVPGHKCPSAQAVRRYRRSGGCPLAGIFNLAFFFHQGRDALVAFDDLFHHGLRGFKMRFLRKIPDVDIFLDLHGPGDGFHLPRG